MTHNWIDLKTEEVLTGRNSEGVRYLGLFLRDYKEAFNVETVNAQCSSCIKAYLKKFKNQIPMSTTDKKAFVLKKKYEGIALEPGSSVRVNNRNITPEYAAQLLKNHDADTIFASYPDKKKKGSKITAKAEEPKPEAAAKTEDKTPVIEFHPEQVEEAAPAEETGEAVAEAPAKEIAPEIAPDAAEQVVVKDAHVENSEKKVVAEKAPGKKK